MAVWTEEELNKIGTAEEVQVTSQRRGGSLRNPVTIWVVRLGDDLYVRSVNGRTSAWFRGVLLRLAGQIRVGSLAKDVSFQEEPAADLNDRLDAVYRTKYRRYAANIVNSIISPSARSATIRLVPLP